MDRRYLNQLASRIVVENLMSDIRQDAMKAINQKDFDFKSTILRLKNQIATTVQCYNIQIPHTIDRAWFRSQNLHTFNLCKEVNDVCRKFEKGDPRETTWSCWICPKQCVSKSVFNTHNKFHHYPAKINCCDLCSARFSDLSLLKQHITKSHKNIAVKKIIIDPEMSNETAEGTGNGTSADIDEVSSPDAIGSKVIQKESTPIPKQDVGGRKWCDEAVEALLSASDNDKSLSDEAMSDDKNDTKSTEKSPRWTKRPQVNNRARKSSESSIQILFKNHNTPRQVYWNEVNLEILRYLLKYGSMELSTLITKFGVAFRKTSPDLKSQSILNEILDLAKSQTLTISGRQVSIAEGFEPNSVKFLVKPTTKRKREV